MRSTIDRAAPPTVGPPPAIVPPAVERHGLDNGLQVLVVRRPGLPIVDLRLVIRAGAAADAPERAGRASLVAEMLDEGTERYSAIELAEELDRLGAELEITATWDAINLSLHVLRPRLEPALDLLAEVVARPTFPEAEVRRVREERLADLARQRQEPRYLAHETFSAVAYGPGHPYAATLSGSPESVQNIGREEIASFYHQHFRPGNAFLVAVGDIDAADLLPLLGRAFDGWAPAMPMPVAPPDRPVARPSTIFLVDRPGAAQSEIQVGHAAAP
ncbi:MAG: pitrilysin family protein, partial [Gemmatimonadota bacterium]